MVLYVTYAYTMLFVGAYALAEDHAVQDNKACGQTYLAFFMWGLLLWTSLSDTCGNLFNKQYHMLYAFHHISTITNGVFFFLFFLHESYLGKAFGGDLTIMAEVHHRYNSATRPALAPELPGGVMSPMPATSPPPPAGLPPQLSYEYEKIMQSTSSSSLPNSTP